MAQGQAVRAKLVLQRRPQDAAFGPYREAGLVHLDVGQAGQIQRDHGPVRPAILDPAHHTGAAAVRDQRGAGARRELERARHLGPIAGKPHEIRGARQVAA
jgi:hypothetical protein